MAAYIIVEVETTDEALMTEYRKHTPGAVAKFGGKFIVRGGKTRTLEGGWAPPRIVVLDLRPPRLHNQTLHQQPLDDPVQRPRAELHLARRLFRDLLEDRVPVQVFLGQRQQDIEHRRRQRRLRIGHVWFVPLWQRSYQLSA